MKKFYVKLQDGCVGSHKQHELQDGIWNSFFANSSLWKGMDYPTEQEIDDLEKELDESEKAFYGDYEFYYEDENND